ncbi:signal peptide peptidase SppA [Enterococcus faecalis]|uniref:signal peptide peptidase SppA n=1 Tax=Enterococcus TaxID=1350 RepID=UPI000352D3C0|nr:signal peptide peptidase SppA [Enterococcus faecalis]EPH79676.1 signal peptide peptidase SppA [Enterococcus faecalis 02-MB-BW-10]EPH82665.1 signal peptide peptidase SppA [Enterococcus faecalis 06-MB-S-10]EPH91612.1 signal peptide peptidase SppA [Enterococcus faecalis 06-MB-S-04]EPI33521.1 signal peptide peptidase SppA [Enterococcus faecalis VC1B-1]MDN3115226.1 signal peptide peptidase SppA [Enterococcus faecalis]
MNKRRWTAIGIAAALFIISIIIAFIPEKETKENTLTGINRIFYGSNELIEETLEEGKDNKKIVKLSVEGTIADTGENNLFSKKTYNHQNFLSQIKKIQEDNTVKGVLLEVNSPGGGVYESAEIAKELEKIKQLKIPIYTTFKDTATSGGYYIAANTDKIFATEETTTGSIGVIISKLNYAGLLKKLGITDSTYKSGALKDMLSSERTPTPEEKEVIQNFVMSSYKRFLNIVAKGRHMNIDDVKKIADGRIYDGTQALENGLIDKIGFPEDALKDLKKEKKLEDAKVIAYKNSTTDFASSLLGVKLAEWQGLKANTSAQLFSILEKLGTSEAPKPMYYYGGS